VQSAEGLQVEPAPDGSMLKDIALTLWTPTYDPVFQLELERNRAALASRGGTLGGFGLTVHAKRLTTEGSASRAVSLLHHALPPGADGAWDVVQWHPDTDTDGQRAIAEKISKLALPEVGPYSTAARNIDGLGHVADVNDLLQTLTRSIKGLHGIKGGEKLKYNMSPTDPGIFTAAPFGAGGP